MGTAEIGALIPIAAMCIPISAIWAKHKRQIAEIQSRNTTGQSSEANAQLIRKTAELEERVRVLERIVTDGGYTLASQIEALRRDDTPLPPPQRSPMPNPTHGSL
jgi:hypothetical protein